MPGLHVHPIGDYSTHPATERNAEECSHSPAQRGSVEEFLEKYDVSARLSSIEEVCQVHTWGPEDSSSNLHSPCSGRASEMVSSELDHNVGKETSDSRFETRMKSGVETSSMGGFDWADEHSLGEDFASGEQSEEKRFDYEIGGGAGVELKKGIEEVTEDVRDEDYLAMEATVDVKADKDYSEKICFQEEMDREAEQERSSSENDGYAFSKHEDCASNEDDVGSLELQASSHLKNFPPPISILAKASHPNLPSHMPRVFWRFLKRGGRFVLQEVQACPRQSFRAIRQDGRLRLQLVCPDTDSAHGYVGDGCGSGQMGKKSLGRGEENAIVILNPSSFVSAEVDGMTLQAGKFHNEEREFEQSTGKEGQKTSLGRGDDNAVGLWEPSSFGADEKALSLSKAAGESSGSEVASPHNLVSVHGTCQNLEVDLEGNASGDQSQLGLKHAQWNGSVGFDNALNLLAPSQSYLHFPFPRMRPVAG